MNYLTTTAMSYCMDLTRRFRDDEEGLALTEYLILLGLLTAAVIGAVLAFGGRLGVLWDTWAVWLNSLDGSPPPLP